MGSVEPIMAYLEPGATAVEPRAARRYIYADQEEPDEAFRIIKLMKRKVRRKHSLQ